MRRFGALVLAAALTLVLTTPILAAKPAIRGFLPSDARPHGYSLLDIGTAFNQWSFGTAEDVNPLLAVRCEPSPLDPRIWFLPVSLGGEWEATCDVPAGTFLVLTPGGWECSAAEPEPFHGGNEEELRACVDAGFELLSYVEVTFNGETVTDLDDYVVTTRMDTLPANNLLGPDPTITMDKGYFMVLAPLGPGTHTLRAYDEFASEGFQAGITYTINVH
jgi:hypothetical protein